MECSKQFCSPGDQNSISLWTHFTIEICSLFTFSYLCFHTALLNSSITFFKVDLFFIIESTFFYILLKIHKNIYACTSPDKILFSVLSDIYELRHYISSLYLFSRYIIRFSPYPGKEADPKYSHLSTHLEGENTFHRLSIHNFSVTMNPALSLSR